MRALVVARDGDVDEAERAVRVAESDDGDVHVRRFRDGLMVGTRVRHDEEPRLAESGLDKKHSSNDFVSVFSKTRTDS